MDRQIVGPDLNIQRSDLHRRPALRNRKNLVKLVGSITSRCSGMEPALLPYSKTRNGVTKNRVTGLFSRFLFFYSFLMLWLHLLNTKKRFEKYNKRYMKTSCYERKRGQNMY